MATAKDYTPIPGFYDLRKFNIPKREFKAFAKIQQFLYRQEERRKTGYVIPDNVRNLSAQYQQLLFAYEKTEGAE